MEVGFIKKTGSDRAAARKSTQASGDNQLVAYPSDLTGYRMCSSEKTYAAVIVDRWCAACAAGRYTYLPQKRAALSAPPG